MLSRPSKRDSSRGCSPHVQGTRQSNSSPRTAKKLNKVHIHLSLIRIELIRSIFSASQEARHPYSCQKERLVGQQGSAVPLQAAVTARNLHTIFPQVDRLLGLHLPGANNAGLASKTSRNFHSIHCSGTRKLPMTEHR
uniref:Uncharacterized protein n=1 Tax=Tetraselmis sp. GSL018 TaxID=582737 RepID=A0A061REB6_9CHLO